MGSASGTEISHVGRGKIRRKYNPLNNTWKKKREKKEEDKETLKP